MPQIVILTSRESHFAPFSRQLAESPECRVQWASALESIDLAMGKAPDLLIIDTNIDDGSALDIAQKVIRVNAMVNMVVVSDLSEEDFHEASEGLGIMARISDPPDAEDAPRILELLRQMPGF